MLFDETGSEELFALLPHSAISSVNLAEVATKLLDRGMPQEESQVSLRALPLRVEGFDEDLALEAAALRPATRSRGLSLGDRACLALAQRLGASALTTDRAWSDLELSVPIVQAR
jgi:ribonuclease VapC